jgi:hypothetical protein
MPADTEEGQTITFHLIKTPGCQTYHADGVIGGFTPHGGAYLGFFTERGTIPQTVTHRIEADGSLGAVVNRTGKEGIVREIQTGVVLDRESIKALHAHLGSMIEQQNPT